MVWNAPTASAITGSQSNSKHPSQVSQESLPGKAVSIPSGSSELSPDSLPPPHPGVEPAGRDPARVGHLVAGAALAGMMVPSSS